jgi:membrane-associated phospholipid phosphatase
LTDTVATHTPGEASPPPLPAESPWRSAGPEQRARRRRLLLVVSVLFVVVSAVFGFPTGREVICGWVLAFLWAALAGEGRVWARVVVRDWLPLIAVLFLYDFLRGVADKLGGKLATLPALHNGRPGEMGIDHAHVLPQLDGDKLMFGGQVPTVWLQHQFYDPAHVHWYDVVAVPVYMSHFIVSMALAVLLWARSYTLFRRYVWTLVTLTFITLVTYAAFPAAPPWMASLNGYLPAGIDRIVTNTLESTGVGTIHSAVERGEAYANAVAAMPSLHGAVPMMLLLFAWPVVRPVTRVLLGLYVLAMLLTLVYSGEHYVTDVLIGWLYAAISVAGVAWWLGRDRTPSPRAPLP